MRVIVARCSGSNVAALWGFHYRDLIEENLGAHANIRKALFMG
jgi:hypothetical protein